MSSPSTRSRRVRFGTDGKRCRARSRSAGTSRDRLVCRIKVDRRSAWSSVLLVVACLLFCGLPVHEDRPGHAGRRCRTRSRAAWSASGVGRCADARLGPVRGPSARWRACLLRRRITGFDAELHAVACSLPSASPPPPSAASTALVGAIVRWPGWSASSRVLAGPGLHRLRPEAHDRVRPHPRRAVGEANGPVRQQGGAAGMTGLPRGLRPRTPSSPGSLAVARSTGHEVPA